MADIKIHKDAFVSPEAVIGDHTEIYRSVIREEAQIGSNCSIRNFVYIDRGVQIGNAVKIMDGAKLYRGVVIKDGVFVGPNVLFLNDDLPRSDQIRDLADKQWTIEEYASLGAGAIILPDISIGAYALIGAGAVVTKDVPAYGLVRGNPARLVKFVCEKAHTLESRVEESVISNETHVYLSCTPCNKTIPILGVSTYDKRA